MEEKIREIVKRTGIPFIDVILYRDHKELYRYYTGEGYTGKEQLFFYSCTKPLTAFCAMKLIEEGKLRLSDPVENYLPAFKGMRVADGESTVEARTKMTVEHLFTMSAGFSYQLSDKAKKLVEENPHASTREVVDALAAQNLLFQPGSRFNYSLCHDILAAVVEEASGMRFSDYVKKTVFEPLNMTHSTFDAKNARLAPQYDCASGVICRVEGENALIYTDRYESGGAGLISTAEDYIRFGDALACGETIEGKRFVKDETIREMQTDRTPAFDDPDSYSCIQGTDYGYGLGVRVRRKATVWGLPAGEFGWDGAAGSYISIDPQNKMSVFIGTHVLNWPRVMRGAHLEIVQMLYEAFLH